MKIYCVNLKRSPERRKAMAAEFARVGLEHEFVDAVDGALLTEEEIRKSYSPWRTRFRRGYGLSRGELGCALSHVGLWRRVAADDDCAVIFEDDITLCDCIREGLAEIAEYLRTDDGPTVVKMSGWSGGNAESGKFIFSNYLTGTYAYALNPAAARLLLKAYTPIQCQIDHYRYMVRHYHLKLYAYDRTIVKLNTDSESTIGANRSMRTVGWRRGAFLLWRLVGTVLDRLLLFFERKSSASAMYVYEGFGDSRYTLNANVNQKPRMVAENLRGVLLAPKKAWSQCSPDLRYAVSDHWQNGRKPIYCQAPTNECAFLGVVLKRIFLLRCPVLFCWDPPGNYWRNRRGLVARLRCWLLNQLQSAAVLCSRVTIFNLHPGFAEANLWKCALKKCRFFPNGTCVAENQRAAAGVEHVAHRVAISNAFLAEKGCFWIADALVELKRKIPDLTIVWVGEDRGDLGAVRERLLAGGFTAADLVQLGPAKHTDALRLWASAEVGFNAYPDQPSVRWNYVLKLPEFMSLGLPIVSVDLPGTREYVTPEVGSLFAPEDEKGAVAALEAMLSNRERIAVAHSAALLSVNNFDWLAVNCKIAEVIKADGV